MSGWVLRRTNVLFRDEFSNLSKWTVINGAWNAANGMLQGTSSVGGEGLIWAGDRGWTNYGVTANVSGVNSREASLVVRYMGPKDFYWLGLGCWGHKYSISKVLNGVPQELTSFGLASELEANKWYLISAVAVDNVLQLFVNNVKVLEWQDTSLSTGAIGFRNWAGTTKVNQILVGSNVNSIGWNIETVDSTGEVSFTSLALDSNGNPHISYYSDDVVKYAAWHPNSGWSIAVVDDYWVKVDIPKVIKFSCLALDSNGNPHICYNCPVTGLKYASWHPSIGWLKIVVDSPCVEQPASLSLDSNGNPHIAYYDSKNRALKYAELQSGSGWSITTVDSNIGGNVSLALDSNDNPHIAYSNNSTANPTPTAELKYAKRQSGSGWSIATLEAIRSHIASRSSLALDSNGNPHICYMVGALTPSGRYLIYAQFNGSVWSISYALTNAKELGSLVLDLDGYPRLSFVRHYSPAPAEYSKDFLSYAEWQPNSGLVCFSRRFYSRHGFSCFGFKRKPTHKLSHH